MQDKNFTTFERQIEILKSRELKFSNEETALNTLRRYGYYNIINGYKDHYIYKNNDVELYRSGVTFEQIYSLYRLDFKLRSQLMSAMLEFEDNLRTALAHTLAEAFTAEHIKYLEKSHYRTGKSREGVFKRDEILNKFQKIINDDSQPVKHYRETYSNVPPWILLKGASLGNIVNFTKLLKSKQKNRVVSLMYDIPLSLVSNELKNLFMDTLFVCLDYRNKAAHGGRIYNYIPKATFRHTSILEENQHKKNKTINATLPILIKALALLDNKNPAVILEGSIDFFIAKHCELYSQDKEYLCKFLCD